MKTFWTVLISVLVTGTLVGGVFFVYMREKGREEKESLENIKYFRRNRFYKIESFSVFKTEQK